jgi:hypothetical protein
LVTNQIATTAAVLIVLIAIGLVVVPHSTTIIVLRITQLRLLLQNDTSSPVGMSLEISNIPVEELLAG